MNSRRAARESAAGTARPRYLLVEGSDLGALPASVRVIDVRDPGEYFQPRSHLERAELVPLSSIAGEARRWDRRAPLLLVCDTGERSRRVADLLGAVGFLHLFVLRGGLLACPLTRSQPSLSDVSRASSCGSRDWAG